MTDLNFDDTLSRIIAMRGQSVPTGGTWGTVRTLHHLAQSIEFSMVGFPQTKPMLFQMTVGKLAYRVFRARGRMSHGLDDAIPGEVIVETGDTALAFDRLTTAMTTFRDHQADLKPHFAYGRLTKNDYMAAHVMHINDHLG